MMATDLESWRRCNQASFASTGFNSKLYHEMQKTYSCETPMTKVSALLIVLAVCVPVIAQSKAAKSSGPDCSDGWPMKMTFVQLKNAGLVDNNSIDSSKTKTVRLASEKIGKDLWHQVYRVTFTKSTAI
jgi:hypothetical protein